MANYDINKTIKEDNAKLSLYKATEQLHVYICTSYYAFLKDYIL